MSCRRTLSQRNSNSEISLTYLTVNRKARIDQGNHQGCSQLSIWIVILPLLFPSSILHSEGFVIVLCSKDKCITDHTLDVLPSKLSTFVHLANVFNVQCNTSIQKDIWNLWDPPTLHRTYANFAVTTNGPVTRFFAELLVSVKDILVHSILL